MAGDLVSGFSNNINVIAIRGAPSVTQKYTDRAIDYDGDDSKESVSVVTTDRTNGNKVKHVVTTPAGAPRTIVGQTNEGDGGVNVSGEEFSEGVS